MRKVTRTGKRNFFGLLDHGMKSIGRFYIQNFEDYIKQKAIDLILGENTDTVNSFFFCFLSSLIIVFTNDLLKKLQAREREYCNYQEISAFIVTWNIVYLSNSQFNLKKLEFQPPSTYDLCSSILNLEGQSAPDLVVIALQEVS